MRILITSAYAPEGETGSAQVSKRLSYKFSDTNEVMYLCLGDNFGVTRVKKNLKLLTIPSTNINDIWIPNINSKIVQKITEELDKFSPEVVHAQNIIYGGLISLIWAKERNVPYVLTFHSIPSEGMGYVFPKIQNDKIISTINYQLTAGYIKNFIKHVDLIVALNQSIVDSLKKLEIETPFRVINNGLELKKFYKLKTFPPKDNIYFIYPGSYVERKNQEYLIKVFSNLPNNYVLKLYGNKTSGNAYVKKLEKLVEEKNVKNVLINDFLDEKDLLFEYERSHYLMSASLKEVQSMVYIESLASGKPIIALENEAVSEIVNKKNGLMLSKKTSPLNFAKKTTKFVNYTLKNYKNISSVCRASVFQFEINTVCEALINAYKYAATIKSSKDITTETKFYQMIKDIIPEQILNIMPENFKFSKEREKTATLKIWLQLSSTFSMLLSIIGLIFLKKRTNN